MASAMVSNGKEERHDGIGSSSESSSLMASVMVSNGEEERHDGIGSSSESSSLMASVMVSNGEEEGHDGAHHQHGQLRLGEARRVILPQARHLHISSIKETAARLAG
jgi:hypothetical protein